MTVDVALDGDRVAAFGQDVRACALGQASAAILGRHVVGATRAEIAATRDALNAMLKQGGPAPQGTFSDLEVLLPAKDYKNRHASILLAWDATLAALDEAADLAVDLLRRRLGDVLLPSDRHAEEDLFLVLAVGDGAELVRQAPARHHHAREARRLIDV